MLSSCSELDGKVQWMNLRNAFQGTPNKFSETMLIKFVGCTSEAIKPVPHFHVTEQGADNWDIWGCGAIQWKRSPPEQMSCWLDRSAAVAAELLCGVRSSAVSTNLTYFLPSGSAAQEDARVHCVSCAFLQPPDQEISCKLGHGFPLAAEGTDAGPGSAHRGSVAEGKLHLETFGKLKRDNSVCCVAGGL